MIAAENEPPIYLDHAATTPVLPEVADAVREAMLAVAGNASSQHAAGRATRRIVEDARERIAELLGAGRGDRLIFTSGGSEANNHALRGAFAGAGGQLIVSSIEHASVAAVARRLEAEGRRVDYLPVGGDGATRLNTLPQLLGPDTRAISLMLGNSETGVLQPVEKLVQATQGQSVAVHTDATQAIGRHSVGFAELGVAMMSFAAHKFHGPTGIGGLLIRSDCHPTPLLAGQSDEERPGTPSAPLVVGMLRALEATTADLNNRIAYLTSVRDRLETALVNKIPRVVVIGRDAPRLPHTTHLAFVGHDRQALLMALDRAGVACSTGSACASGSSEPSPVLTAMGLDEDQIRGGLRFSVGAETTAAEVDLAAQRIQRVCRRLSAADGG